MMQLYLNCATLIAPNFTAISLVYFHHPFQDGLRNFPFHKLYIQNDVFKLCICVAICIYIEQPSPKDGVLFEQFMMHKKREIILYLGFDPFHFSVMLIVWIGKYLGQYVHSLFSGYAQNLFSRSINDVCLKRHTV